jgi:hypothetical protein
MVDHRSRFRSQDPDFEGYNEDITGRGARSGARSYSFGRTARQDFAEDESAPLFLSDSEDEYTLDQDGGPDPWESQGLLRKNKSSVSLKILMGVLAASAVAMLFALFTSDAMRDAIDSAKASFATVLPVPSANAQSDQTQLTARDIQLKDPTRLGAAAANRAGGPQPQTQIAMASPSREEISSAYQSALQRAPTAPSPPAAGPQPVTALSPAAAPAAVAPPAAAPQQQQFAAVPPPSAAVAAVATPVAPPVVGPSPVIMPSPIVRHIDPDELAMLMKRARGLLASGDIPPARLLLERAADAQDPGAAFLLAQTYDPDVLGARDARTITPDPVAARAWYQKAAQLGSADAQRRLAQMQ